MRETLQEALDVRAEGLVIDDRENRLFRVNRRAFVDDEVLAMEREKIFDKCWLFAGHASEVPKVGDFLTRQVAGRPIIMVHGDDDQIRVFMNTCRHRGNIVARPNKGQGAEVLRCFYHGWIYGLRGELKGVPGEDAYSEAFDRDALGLESPPGVENYRGCIFVAYDPDIESFEDYMGEMRTVLDTTLDFGDLEFVGGEQKYSIRANWKLLVENSMDGYHAAFTHERYMNFLQHMDITDSLFALAPGSQNNAPMPRMTAPMGHGHVTGSLPRPRADGAPRGGLTTYLEHEAKPQMDEYLKKLAARFGFERATEVERGSGNYLIFPNLIIIDGWRTFRTFYPSEPGYMEITAWAAMPKEEGPELRAARLDAFLTFLGPGGFATPDDVEGLEGCQMGFAAHKEVEWSDISRGMGAPTVTADELQMRTFWREWYSRMTTGRHTDNPFD